MWLSHKVKKDFEKQFENELEKARRKESEITEKIDEIVYNKLGLSKTDRMAITNGLKRLRELRKSVTRGLRKDD